jgi:hypothetical protein
LPANRRVGVERPVDYGHGFPFRSDGMCCRGMAYRPSTINEIGVARSDCAGRRSYTYERKAT